MKLTTKLAALLVAAGSSSFGVGSLALAQDAMPAPAPVDAAAPTTTLASTNPQQQRAARLIDEALAVAYNNPEARPALARGAATLLPQLDGRTRMGLTNRWIALIHTDAVSRGLRLSAISALFDATARSGDADDLDYGRDVALALPDPVARTSAFIKLSEAAEKSNWSQAAEWAAMAQRAARQEPDLRLRARALAYVATRMATLDPTAREAAVIEASSQARLIQTTSRRDTLLAETVGAASKFDIGLAQRISTDIQDEDLRNLATARIAVAQTQATFAVRKPDADRIAQIVQGVPRYDTSFIPVLLQLPPSPEVFQALGKALPVIYPDAPLAVDAGTLERVWNYAAGAPPSVYRDQLQSRVARLMVLHDLWRGREWGRQLAWEGGRNQIARFVDATVRARESELQTDQLRAQTIVNVNTAVLSTRNLTPSERVEALLLIAGQILS